jgi:hypothetical protein
MNDLASVRLSPFRKGLVETAVFFLMPNQPKNRVGKDHFTTKLRPGHMPETLRFRHWEEPAE